MGDTMPAGRFKKPGRFSSLFPKLTLASTKKPKTTEARIHQLENDVRDLRSVMRELIETLEWELGRDLDQNHRVGKVSPRRGLPKTARLEPIGQRRASRLEQKPAPLPPNIP
jgi:hypothetical protein